MLLHKVSEGADGIGILVGIIRCHSNTVFDSDSYDVYYMTVYQKEKSHWL